VDYKGINKLINNAMRKLPEADYDILYELYFKHTSVHQLSRSLGITCKAVRWRRDKALKQLKKIILKNQAKN
jgi:RNA polymerase sigma factor (sigma-70 family)